MACIAFRKRDELKAEAKCGEKYDGNGRMETRMSLVCIAKPCSSVKSQSWLKGIYAHTRHTKVYKTNRVEVGAKCYPQILSNDFCMSGGGRIIEKICD